MIVSSDQSAGPDRQQAVAPLAGTTQLWLTRARWRKPPTASVAAQVAKDQVISACEPLVQRLETSRYVVAVPSLSRCDTLAGCRSGRRRPPSPRGNHPRTQSRLASSGQAGRSPRTTANALPGGQEHSSGSSRMCLNCRPHRRSPWARHSSRGYQCGADAGPRHCCAGRVHQPATTAACARCSSLSLRELDETGAGSAIAAAPCIHA